MFWRIGSLIPDPGYMEHFEWEWDPFLRVAPGNGHATPVYPGKTYPVAFSADLAALSVEFEGFVTPTFWGGCDEIYTT